MSVEALKPRRLPRWRLYAPYILLALVAVGWSVAWFVIRGRVVGGLDEWVAAEAEQGRRWTCADRQVGGYPFRIEIICATLSLERPDVSATLGRVLVAAQIYNPNHIIAEAASPLHVVAGSRIVDATWKLLQTSVVLDGGRFARTALVLDEPTVHATAPDIAPLDISSRRLELHVRPDPADRSAFDAALSTLAAKLPGLDELVGGAEAADLDLRLLVTQANDLPARPIWSELERWRISGGRLGLTRFGMTKGARRIEATGNFTIDELHRPQGEMNVSALGLEGLLGRYAGDKSLLAGGGLLGALLGGRSAVRQEPAPPDPKAPALKPLPPFRLDGGRLVLGPFTVPGIRIPPLY